MRTFANMRLYESYLGGSMKQVTIKFNGTGAEKCAKDLYYWLVDGGLEDYIIDNLSDNETEVEGICGFSNEELVVTFKSKKK